MHNGFLGLRINWPKEVRAIFALFGFLKLEVPGVYDCHFGTRFVARLSSTYALIWFFLASTLIVLLVRRLLFQSGWQLQNELVKVVVFLGTAYTLLALSAAKVALMPFEVPLPSVPFRLPIHERSLRN